MSFAAAALTSPRVRPLLAVAALLLAPLCALLASKAHTAGSPAASRPTAHVEGAVKLRPVKHRAVKHRAARHRRLKHRTVKTAKREHPAVKHRTVKHRIAAHRPAKAQAAAQSVANATALPNDPLWRESWALPKVHALEAWKSTTGRPETVVAVLDTGADAGHPDLQSSLVPGYDVVNHDADPADDHGHGTMVAGVIAARSNNGIGVTSACWRCSVMPVKVIGADGSGRAADVAEGILWATDHGAAVINMSFTMTGPDAAVEQAIAYAVGHGVVVVAAAGNDGGRNPNYPAAYPGVLGVAGTGPDDAAYPWSSSGSWVRLAAPGCSLTTIAGGSYGDFCGTSSASAFVSGLAGLARSFDAGLPAAAIAAGLLSSAKPIGDAVSGGRVDAGALLQALGAGKPAAAPPREQRGHRESDSNA